MTEHRIALLRSLSTDLLRHEHIQTTVPKAKELRPFVERIITIAKRGITGAPEPVRAMNARRLVLRASTTRRWSRNCSPIWRRGSPSAPAATRGCSG